MNKTQLYKIAETWFQDKGWKPFPFQKQTWKAFLSGQHGLLNAPTGSGKTYALWFPIVLQFIKDNPDYARTGKGGLKAIWITPLRALSHEILQSTQKVVDDLKIPITIGIRTGDTTTKERAKQKRKMPELLITTPESLHLLLATKGYARIFNDCSAIVVDEWHELLGTKRGVQMELGLSRVRSLTKNLRIWGISATIGNLEQAREVLLGPATDVLANSILIKAKLKKKITVKSIIPKRMETFPWRGHLGLSLLENVVPIINASKTTLLFTNTRSQCELWFQKILEKHPEYAGVIAMHHSSIKKETRIWVEKAIRNGDLKAVVCTSGLDLGVDFAPVETVVQIGGPKGIARFLQRAGRSGHRPGKESVIYFLPTHALELVESSALQKAVRRNVVEDRMPYINSYDVLLQYLTTLAVSDGFDENVIFEEVKRTFCFQALTEDIWDWLLNFLVKGSQSLESYDEYKKVEIVEDGIFKVTNKGVAMRHRFQIGTIVSNVDLTVHYQSGGYIGSIEEFFVSKLNRGDVFTFAGRNLEFIRMKGMKVQVRNSTKRTRRVPSWNGGQMTLSAQLSNLLRDELYTVNLERKKQSREIKALMPLFEQQCLESMVPRPHQLLIETFKTRQGYHNVFYPFEGRFVHEAMGSLIGYRISLLSPITFSLAFNDYGFELLSDRPLDMQQVLDNNLFTTDYMFDDLQKSLNSTEMARRQFRNIAVISGMVFTGYPKKGVKMKHLQSGSQLLFDVFKDYEDNNLLYRQAFTETFEHHLEEGRLRLSLQRIAAQEVVWKDCTKPTPLSFPLITDRMLREKLSSEKWEDRIKRMVAILTKN